MTAPPPGSAGTQAPTSGQMEREHLSPRVLMREAAKVSLDMGLEIRPDRLRRIVSRFLAIGRADIDFRTWFIAYADPTGETAVRNVMRANNG